MKKIYVIVPIYLGMYCAEANANIDVNAQRYLLNQVEFAAQRNNYNLLKQSLDKLDMVNPNHPKVLLGWINYAIKIHDQSLAKQKFKLLQNIGANSSELIQAKALIASTTPQFSNKLSQARYLAGQGKIAEASHIYQALFSDQPPAPLALEYWTILAYSPATQAQALHALSHIAGGDKVIANVKKSRTSIDHKAKNNKRTLQLVKVGQNRIKQQRVKTLQKNQQIFALQYKIKQLSSTDNIEKKIVLQKKLIVLQPMEIWNSYDLAMSYAQNDHVQQANQVFSRYFKQYPSVKNGRKNKYVYALYLNATDQIDAALQQLKGLDIASQNKQIQQLYQQIETKSERRHLTQQAEKFEQQQQYADLIVVQQKIIQLEPHNIWAVFDLSQSYLKTNQKAQADQLFLNEALKSDDQYHYVYALYLFSTGQYQAAFDHLNQIDPKHQDQKVKSLLRDIQIEQKYQEAEQSWAHGKTMKALDLMITQPNSLRKNSILAEWYMSLQNTALAEQYYHLVLEDEPNNIQAQLGLATLYLSSQPEKAKQLALAVYQTPFDGINEKRKLARILFDLNLTVQADEIYSQLAQLNLTAPSQDAAQIKNDLAKWLVIEHRRDEGLTEWKKAMYLAGLTKHVAEDNIAFTQAMRMDAQDNWLQRDIKQSSAQVYQQQERTISSGLSYDYYQGMQGTSQVNQATYFLQAQFPLADGQALLQSNWSNFDAGNFQNANPAWATCTTGACTNLSPQKQGVTTVAFDWKNKHWDIAIGSISSQDKDIDVLGGLRYRNLWKKLNYQVSAERYRLSNSLLSYYGQTDPLTGIDWGAIHVDQLGLKLDYMLKSKEGLWLDFDVAHLTGHNVKDNSRIRGNVGYHYELIDQPQQKLITGVDLSAWHYDQNLSGFTLTQGGYYSPQQYYSFGIPIEWYKATAQWSWGLKSRLSYSYAKMDEMSRYPLKTLINESLSDINVIESGKTSQGFGYTLKLFAEKRITPHWFLGAAANLEYQKDYVPSNIMLYFRYSMEGWNGNMSLPTQPPVLFNRDQ